MEKIFWFMSNMEGFTRKLNYYSNKKSAKKQVTKKWTKKEKLKISARVNLVTGNVTEIDDDRN